MSPHRRRIPIAVFALCSTFAGASVASDHTDGPAISKDPTADITDLYAFRTTERGGRLVLVLNVHPGAFQDARFSDAVVYSFRVRPDNLSVDREVRIDCSFDAGGMQRGACTGYSFVPSTKRLLKKIGGETFTVGAVGGEIDGFRVFAGLRADPFFIDAKGAPAGIRGDRFAFTGDNALKGLDVLSIVVELDERMLLAGATGGKYRIVAETSVKVVRS